MNRLYGARGRQTGQALVAVLVAAVLVLSILGGLMLQARGDMRRARDQADWEAAFYLAWAGVEHVLAELSGMNARDLLDAPDGSVLVTVAETPMGRGTYTATASVPEEGTAAANYRFAVRSAGRVGRARRTIVATVAWRMAQASYYHIWSRESFRIDASRLVNINGDIFSLEDITLDGQVVARGSAFAGGSVYISGAAVVQGEVYERVTSMEMPRVETAPLQPLTTTELTETRGQAVVLDCSQPNPDLCQGDRYIWSGSGKPLWVKGTFYGRFVISAAGPIYINGNVWKGTPDSIIGFVTEGDLTLRGGITCQCLLFSGMGKVTTPGDVLVEGIIIANRLDNKGILSFDRDLTLRDLMPGLPGVTLMATEWDEESP